MAGLMGKPQAHVIQESAGRVKAAGSRATAPAAVWDQASAEPLGSGTKGSSGLSRPALPSWEGIGWGLRRKWVWGTLGRCKKSSSIPCSS